MVRTLAASGLVLVIGLWMLASATFGFTAFTQEAARKMAVQQQPLSLPGLALQRQDGHETTLEALRGRWVVATFIYTSCHDICPLITARMQEIRTRLNDVVEASDVHFLSISFDPEVDTPQRLTRYAELFGAHLDDWWMVRPREDVHPLLDLLGVVVIPMDHGMYEHNAAFYVIDPDSRLIDILDVQATDRVVDLLRARH